jgi:uncharacterized protein YcaQ
LFTPVTLARAIDRMGFLQADPIRAPARAQDLTLRHRVRDYRAGDLERRYPKLSIEEDFFVNYGFLPRKTHALLHPRTPQKKWSRSREDMAAAVLGFVRERGVVHPRDVDAHFQHGKVQNWFGGTTNASTQLLDQMHYRGLVRIAGRTSGTRLYAVREATPRTADPRDAMDTLVDVIVGAYAPLPERSLGELVRRLRSGAPQWADDYRSALARSRMRLPSAEVDGRHWYWPANEDPRGRQWSTLAGAEDEVRLLSPFDPVVWDRRRFEILWGWAYRFEAYVPAAKRIRGYYALPLLWRDRVIGWGNLAVVDDRLRCQLGYVSGKPPRDASFKRALEVELERLQSFLGVE